MKTVTLKAAICAAAMAVLIPGAALAQDIIDLVDNSVGYVNVAPGVVLVEGERISHLCAFAVDGKTPTVEAMLGSGDGLTYVCHPLERLKPQ